MDRAAEKQKEGREVSGTLHTDEEFGELEEKIAKLEEENDDLTEQLRVVKEERDGLLTASSEMEEKIDSVKDYLNDAVRTLHQ